MEQTESRESTEVIQNHVNQTADPDPTPAGAGAMSKPTAVWQA